MGERKFTNYSELLPTIAQLRSSPYCMSMRAVCAYLKIDQSNLIKWLRRHTVERVVIEYTTIESSNKF